MHDTRSSDWQKLLGELGQPIPKLTKPDKQRLKSILQSTEGASMERAWRVRACVATGFPLPLTGVDPSLIAQVAPLLDLTRNMRALCTFDRILRGEILLRALIPQINSTNARFVLSALVRMLARPVNKKRKATEDNQSLPRLDSATALVLLDAASRIASSLFRRSESKTRRKQTKKKHRAPQDLLLDVAFQTLSRCECATVCSASLELASMIHRNLGTSTLDDELERGEPRWTYLVSAPSRLIPNILTQGCLSDAELLDSRSLLLAQARRLFEDAVRETLTRKGSELPLASRQWAEQILGYKSPAEVRAVAVDVAADVNLERMGVLLLASWDAKDEGPRALHLFEVFSGICRTAFRLSLVGEHGQITSFDPTRHQPAEGSVILGKGVRLLRPAVQWSEGPMVRIIVRALVAPT